MMRSLVAVGVLGLVGLFGFYYVSARGDKSPTEKMKEAAAQVGDTLADRGIAATISGRFMHEFKKDARFLHVHYDEGTVTIYGMAPASVTPDQIDQTARLPGVKDVRIHVQPLPEHLGGEPRGGGEG